jgi:hypothetical protein
MSFKETTVLASFYVRRPKSMSAKKPIKEIGEASSSAKSCTAPKRTDFNVKAVHHNKGYEK